MIFWLKNNWRDKYNDSELSPEERKLAVARMKKLEAETKNVQLRNKSLEENDEGITKIVFSDDLKPDDEQKGNENDGADTKPK